MNNTKRTIIVTLGLTFLVILSFLLHRSLNKVNAEMTSPTEIQGNTIDNIIEVKETTDIVELRKILQQQLSLTLKKSGWIQIYSTHENYTNAEEAIIVPDTGQIIPKNWIDTTWIYIDETGNCLAMTSERTTLEGQVVSSIVISDGSKWKAINPSDIRNIDLEAFMRYDYIDRVIAAGDSANLSIDYETINDQKIVSVSSIDKNPRGGNMEGIDQLVFEVHITNYYDLNTGLFLYSEHWVTLEDGTQQKINKTEYDVSITSEVSMNVLDKLEGDE